MGEPADLTHPVSSALAPYVRRITGFTMPDLQLVHHGLPSTELTMIVAFERALPVGWTPDAAQARLLPTMVAGMHAAPAYVFPCPGLEGIQLDLTPAGARALLRVPAAEVHASIADLGELCGAAGTAFTERVGEAKSWPDRFQRVEDALLDLLDVDVEIRAELRWAWGQLLHRRPVRTAALADEIGWSRGYFARLFAGEYGLLPKETSRVVRFDRARRALAAATRDPGRNASTLIADTAYAFGYADQAHLTREWRRLAGYTPTQYQAEVLAFVQAG